MKKILLLAALAGITTGSYAQDKDCTCKKTTMQRKAHTTRVVTRVPTQPSPTCFLDKKKNAGIPGCNEVVYGRDNSYTGYYPTTTKKATKTVTKKNTVEVAAATVNCDVPAVKTATYIYTPAQPPQPCYTYTTKSGIVVKQCPDNLYSSTPAYAPIDYSSKRVYMGYYPTPDETKDPRLMENRPIEGTHFPDQELYFWGSEK